MTDHKVKKSDRAGKYELVGSIRSFKPEKLPPIPAIQMTPDLTLALSHADRALARLDGAFGTIPNADMLVYAFMRQEAVLSSQIEGTQASLEDLLEYEIDDDYAGKASDLFEVINYLDAMKWSVSEIKTKPISLNLLKRAHALLLSGGRGANRVPGEFRQNQNWIGPPGCEIQDASFVPPAVPHMTTALHDLENYVNTPSGLPDSIQCALIHAQFETIHPFWDGNGRLGRMLITLFLCERKVLEKPVLYLSLFFKSHREAYYELLQNVRDTGNWEAWVLFFLRGVTQTSRSALKAVTQIRALRESLIQQANYISQSPNAQKFGEMLFSTPYVTSKSVQTGVNISPATANSLIKAYCDADMLRQVGSGKRNRIFAFKPYLDILHECADDLTVVIVQDDHLVTGYHDQ